MALECCGGPAARAEALAAVAPGADLAAMLDGVDVAELRCEGELLEIVAAWDRIASWAQARQLEAIAEFSRRPSMFGRDHDASWAARGPVGHANREFGDDEIAARLSISRVAASTRVEVGAALAGGLPGTHEALRAGHIDMPKARLIVENCRGLAADVAREVEERVLPRAGEQNCGRLRQSLRRAVIAAEPSHARVREAKAKAGRKVVITPIADGMAELYAVLPALAATAIDMALTAAARATRADHEPGDERTMDQLRADALAAPFEAALASGVLDGARPTKLARVRGARASLHVTVPASVLLGISDAPGELAGYGPISADVAREIAGDATWRRILTNPVDGSVLDVGATTYRPPAALDRLVKTRDGTCRFVGCNWPAMRCELDHSTRFPDGPTAAANLGSFCKRHHLFKHAAPDGQRLRQISPGVFRWSMPTGHIYTVRPPAVALPPRQELRIRARLPGAWPEADSQPP